MPAFRHRQNWLLQQGWASLQSFVPGMAGCAMLLASLLPWLNDPLGAYYSAWSLSFNIGWPLQSRILSYGLLCLCCGIYALVIAYLNWKALNSKETVPVQRPLLAGILCIALFALFLWQYLCVDLETMNRLAQHQIQAILTQRAFGYSVPAQLFPIDLYAWDISTFVGRFQLLASNVGIGLFLPLFCGLMLLESRRLFSAPPLSVKKRCIRKPLVIGLFLVFVGGPACGLAALECEYRAESLLSTGEYATALNWLDVARMLNPTFDRVSFYHIERGQAWYFLHPEYPNDESMLYLAYTYRQQRYYADAYQQLMAVWNQGHRPSWLVDEISVTLGQFAQSFRPLSSVAGQPDSTFGMIQPAQGAQTYNNPTGQGTTPGSATKTNPTGSILLMQRMKNDTLALPWLEKLRQIDPSNVYAQYLSGRIQCDLHDYVSCQEQMYTVLQFCSNTDVQSSAYTYLAISASRQGDYVSARKFLLKAVALDYAYRNNIAREELSGLH